MKTLSKLALAAVMAGGLAATAAGPATAAVHVGIGIGVPVAHRHWCRHRPCHRAVIVAPRIGVFYTGRGWWDGHRYWAHRERWHGHWRYR